MTTTQAGEPASPKKLRLWPGIVAVVLQWIFRFGVKALIPGIQGFGYAVMGSLIFALVLIVWWVFFSRARRVERWGGLGVIVIALGGSWLLKHESMWLPWLFAYAIPFLCLAFVVWAVATSRMPDRIRRATMIATIVVACGAWMLFRQNGINGDHKAEFGWRWAASTEEKLVAQEGDAPAAAPTATASVAP